MSLLDGRRDSGSFPRRDSGEISGCFHQDGTYCGPERRRISGEFVVQGPEMPKWLKTILGTLLVLGAAAMGSVITHEREHQNQTDRLTGFELRMSTVEEAQKHSFVTREEFMQFSARVLDGQNDIKSEVTRLRQELEHRR